MSYGSTAYESFVRIHIESGETRQPTWTALPHLGRLAWEAAAQAVAMAVLPAWLNPEPLDEHDEEEMRNEELRIRNEELETENTPDSSS